MVKFGFGAGHGINTPGKRTPSDEREWTFNNKVVTAAIKRLNDYQDVTVVRLDDSTGKRDVPLKDRTDKANKEKVDALISYHHNANTGRWGSWTGTETYHFPNSTSGRELALAIHPAIVKTMGLRDRGIKTANFHMLRDSRMPAILIEGGFMDSTIDIKKMRNDKVLENTGIALADALASYYALKPKPKPKPPVNKGGLYYVQIGAFSKKANADSLERQAKAKGYDAFIKHEDSVYKVQLGAFSSKKNADSLAARAKKSGFDVYINR